MPVLTEDFLYLKMNELETNKKAPKYFSSLALLRVLYEIRKITFDEYLDYFGYLSSYRFRFLSVHSNDIEKAVFGDGIIKTVKPENIRKLNFPLTLSEEYGVPFQTAFSVVANFLLKILLDDSIIVEIAERIFIEILESFPSEKSKKDLGQIFLIFCQRVIENKESNSVLLTHNQMFNEKLKDFGKQQAFILIRYYEFRINKKYSKKTHNEYTSHWTIIHKPPNRLFYPESGSRPLLKLNKLCQYVVCCLMNRK